jgi:hypothetical protein
MAVNGTINVNLSALDTYTADGVHSEKKVVLSSSDNLPSAVVAVASGTCGTTAETIDITNFRGADGELVAFGAISGLDDTLRICFSATPAASLKFVNTTIARGTDLHSVNGKPSISFLSKEPENNPLFFVSTQIQTGEPSYTASYTLVLIKET